MGYRGKHRKPTTTGKTVARAATVGVVAFTPLSIAAPFAHADTAPLTQLASLLFCESGGNPKSGVINWTRENEQRSSASGAFQIIDSTWRIHGGLAYAKRAKDATPQQQTIVAARIAQSGGVSQWACAGKAGFTDPSVITWANVQRLTGGTVASTTTPRATPRATPRETPTPKPATPRATPRETPTQKPATPRATPTSPSDVKHYRVAPGNTLSGIAFDYRLDGWQSLYEENRELVGSNPNLILPGQNLSLPGGTPARVTPSPKPRVAPTTTVKPPTTTPPAATTAKPPLVIERVADAPRADAAPALAGFSASGFGGVSAKVAQVGHLIQDKFTVAKVLGVGPRPRPSDHTSGYALDFMVNRVTGDKVAEYAVSNMKTLGVKYIIWKQRINYGSGWKLMEDRGSATENHMDHVHLSFTK